MPGRYGVVLLTDWSAAAFLLMALGSGPAEASAADPIQFAQVVIREQILVRVPVRLREAQTRAAVPVEWKESRGPKCLPMRSLAGATLLGRNSVDLILRDRSRIRARLEKSCPALDYYYGFYIRPNADGQICADRDVIRSRMGGQCEIEKFRTLTAERPD
jgi:hypothetical protein